MPIPMKNTKKSVLSAILLIAVLTSSLGLLATGCKKDEKRGKPVAIATITIIADLVRNIAGDRVEVISMLPLATDPHTYEPVPGDVKTVAQSDILFYNGLGLELWLRKILDNAGGERPHIELTLGLEPVMTSTGHTDPHTWMNPRFVLQAYIPNILGALVELDPEGEELFRENARVYGAKFVQLDTWARHELEAIAPEDKKLVTTHDAFSYFGEHYGFEIIGSIWGVSTEDEPSPKDVAVLVERIRTEGVKSVFIETTINPKLMRAIAREAGVGIGRPLYGDSLGKPGSGAETYIGMVRENVRSLVDALSAGEGES